MVLHPSIKNIRISPVSVNTKKTLDYLGSGISLQPAMEKVFVMALEELPNIFQQDPAYSTMLQTIYSHQNNCINGFMQTTARLTIFLSASEVKANYKMLEDRFSQAKTIPGARSHNCFVPISTSALKLHGLSMDSATSTTDRVNEPVETSVLDNLHNGHYCITVTYNWDWYLGCIMEKIKLPW